MTPAIYRRLLIADDDVELRLALRDVFVPAGFEVMLAATGEETLEFMDKNTPVDCILIDMNLPGISGLETIQELYKSAFAPPSILLTAHPTQDVLQRALILRVFTVLAKPVVKALVTHTVDRAIRSHLSAS